MNFLKKIFGRKLPDSLNENHLINEKEFEIRLCKETLGSDTLCFLPLSKKQWLYFDPNYPKQVREKFEIMTPNKKIFT